MEEDFDTTHLMQIQSLRNSLFTGVHLDCETVGFVFF